MVRAPKKISDWKRGKGCRERADPVRAVAPVGRRTGADRGVPAGPARGVKQQLFFRPVTREDPRRLNTGEKPRKDTQRGYKADTQVLARVCDDA